MTKRLYEEQDITNIAEAIRTKSGSSDKYKISEMANAIENLPSGGDIDWDDYFGIIEDTTNYSQTSEGPNSLFVKGIKQVPKLQLSSKSTSLYGLFSNASSLIDLKSVKNWDTSKIQNMCGICYRASNLTSLNGLENWNTSSARNLYAAFNQCTNVTDITQLADWNISNVTTLGYTFCTMRSLEDISALEHWDTTKVTNMSYTFQDTPLSSLKPIANWHTGNVTNMSSMFSRLYAAHCNEPNTYKKCVDLNDIKDWDTTKVTNMNGMFAACHVIMDNIDFRNSRPDTIELNWDISSVTNMSTMFKGGRWTSNLEYTQLIKKKFIGFKTTKTITSNCNFSDMFNSQFEVEEIDMSEVNKLRGSMSYMFQDCKNLKRVDIRGLYNNSGNSSANGVNYLFSGCTSLELADIRGLVCSGLTSSTYYTNALRDVPTTAKIIVKNTTEKNWWKSKFANWSSCFYTVDEAIAEGIITD